MYWNSVCVGPTPRRDCKMALDLLKEITQIGEFLRAQREVLPAETWSQMNSNHVSAIHTRIGSLASLTALDATQMVEGIRTAHFMSEDKAAFCSAVSARLTELETSPKKSRKENQTCAGFYNFLSRQDRDVLKDPTASQTTKLTQLCGRCCRIGLMWPSEQSVGRILSSAVAAGLQSVDSEASFLNAVQEFKKMLRKQRDKTPVAQWIQTYPDDPSSLPPVLADTYQADPASPVQVADVMAVERLVTLRICV